MYFDVGAVARQFSFCYNNKALTGKVFSRWRICFRKAGNNNGGNNMVCFSTDLDDRVGIGDKGSVYVAVDWHLLGGDAVFEF